VNWSSVFCMFGMALTRPSLTMQLKSGMDVFAHACWQKADTSSNYCDNIQPYDKRRLCFCQMLHDFQIFFWKLPQFHTSNFCRVVWQHTEVVMGSVILVLLEIYLAFQHWKNFENPLRIDKVITMSLEYYFFGTQCITNYWSKVSDFSSFLPIIFFEAPQRDSPETYGMNVGSKKLQFPGYLMVKTATSSVCRICLVFYHVSVRWASTTVLNSLRSIGAYMCA